MITAIGVDIGSLTTKSVVLNETKIISSAVIRSSDETELCARTTIEQALQQIGLSFNPDIKVIATGLGSKSVTFSQSKLLTTCLARGVNSIFPTARMAIDMGAESSTIIKLNERGRLTDWLSQDKCAAGTGVFLEQMAKLMNLTSAEMDALSFKAKFPPEITATCAVFAESEVISHVHRVPATLREDIAAGIYRSVLGRIISMCKRIGIQREVVATGGVAMNKGIIAILNQELGFDILVPDNPQIVAALGAAIFARETATGAKI
jgi:predicted CoA-substrate-specific enzyme activase